MKYTRFTIAISTAALIVLACGKDLPQLGKDPVKDVVAAMTRSERQDS